MDSILVEKKHHRVRSAIHGVAVLRLQGGWSARLIVLTGNVWRKLRIPIPASWP